MKEKSIKQASILTIAAIAGLVGISLAAAPQLHADKSYSTEQEKKEQEKKPPRIMTLKEALRHGTSPEELDARRRKVGQYTMYVPVDFSPAKTGIYMKIALKNFWNDLESKIEQYTPLKDYIHKYYGKYMNNPIVKAQLTIKQRHEDINTCLNSYSYTDKEKAERVFLHMLAITVDTLKTGPTKEKNNDLYQLVTDVNDYYKRNPAMIDNAKSDAKNFINSYKDILNVFK